MRNWIAIAEAFGCLRCFCYRPVAFAAAAKVHAIAFGKWTSVQTLDADGEDNAKPIKIRALIVDGRVKEYATGATHEVTDRLFVVRRAFRVNDSLPEDAAPRWQWQVGGWLLVDRVTARVSVVNLPEFDGHIRRLAGIATTRLTAVCRTMGRNRMRSWRSWREGSRF